VSRNPTVVGAGNTGKTRTSKVKETKNIWSRSRSKKKSILARTLRIGRLSRMVPRSMNAARQRRARQRRTLRDQKRDTSRRTFFSIHCPQIANSSAKVPVLHLFVLRVRSMRMGFFVQRFLSGGKPLYIQRFAKNTSRFLRAQDSRLRVEFLLKKLIVGIHPRDTAVTLLYFRGNLSQNLMPHVKTYKLWDSNKNFQDTGTPLKIWKKGSSFPRK